jgi:hypothetical protein
MLHQIQTRGWAIKEIVILSANLSPLLPPQARSISRLWNLMVALLWAYGEQTGSASDAKKVMTDDGSAAPGSWPMSVPRRLVLTKHLSMCLKRPRFDMYVFCNTQSQALAVLQYPARAHERVPSTGTYKLVRLNPPTVHVQSIVMDEKRLQ